MLPDVSGRVDAPAPATLHSLAFVYLACSQLPDGEVATSEMGAIVSRMLAWTSVGDEQIATDALKSAVASYQACDGADEELRQLVQHAEYLRMHLTPEQCQQVISDLITIVEADHKVLASESDFVLAAAKSLGVDVKRIDHAT